MSLETIESDSMTTYKFEIVTIRNLLAEISLC